MSTFMGNFPWMNREFVQNLIEKSENRRDVALKSFHGENALFNGGENFSSSMIRLKVIFDLCKYKEIANGETAHREEKQRVFIIKVALETEKFSTICVESALFEKEIEAYTKILPEAEKLLQSIGLDGQLAPRCYMTDLKRRMIVFEDLSLQQFKNTNKADGLDNDHMKFVLVALAKWHASTAILLIEKPELFVEHKKKKWYKNGVIVRKFFEDIAKTVSSTAKNWPGYERIAEKIANIPKHAYDNVYKWYLPTEGAFNTLAHGDMWSNNIMFCHDQSGIPTDIRFVDFALGKHMNPTLDLVCLLYGCSHLSQKQKDREELIQFYHSELVKLLKKLNYPEKLPSLLEIQTAAFRVDLYNALIVMLVIGIRYVGISTEFTALVDGSTVDRMFSHPECINKLKYILNLFDRRGYFDFE